LVQADLFYRFGIALVIGILVGLERERSGRQPDQELLAGVRTFALFGLAGCTAALISDQLSSSLPFVTVTVIIGALLAVAHFAAAIRREHGLTTEVSAVLTTLAGALCYWQYLALATAIGVVTTILLSFKLEMHRFAQQISSEDVYATLKFAVITTIVLPVLPNEGIGPPPLDIINPYRIWLMVVLISGLSFLGYVLMKIVDPQRGIGLTGLLGGIISSTAVTLTFSERSQRHPELGRTFAFAIVLSWTVMFARVLILVAVINRPLLQLLWPSITAAGLMALLYVTLLNYTAGSSSSDRVMTANPFELIPALKFGLLFAAILLLARIAELYWSNTGILLSSAISGIADVDAITVSLSQLSLQSDRLSTEIAARAIVLATMVNTGVKAGVVLSTGTATLRRSILLGAILIAVTGMTVVFLSI
jgi:uncharacterized membrane protein (DUF4010 family)